MWPRLKPAFSLVVLAPLIAEYLLGSLSFRQLPLFPLMMLMYGAGALLVREAARRSGRGWPAIILLGLAYALIEEGLATQSLFNPHYLGLRLLDHGFIPALGIGGPWTVYVIVLHVAWSVAVPIGFTEFLFPARRGTPWLGAPGLGVCGLAYAGGVALVWFGTRQKEKFSASEMQLLAVAAIAAALVLAAFALVHREGGRNPGAPATRWIPRNLGVLAFVAGSAFHWVAQFGNEHLAPMVAAVIALAIPSAVLGIVQAASMSEAWSPAHVDGLVLGGLLAYCWLGFLLVARLHGPGAWPGQAFPLAIVVGLVWWRSARLRSESRRGGGARE